MTIDAYMVRLAKFLTVSPATRPEILQEVLDHLEDATPQIELTGTPRLEAEDQAVTGFGAFGRNLLVSRTWRCMAGRRNRRSAAQDGGLLVYVYWW